MNLLLKAVTYFLITGNLALAGCQLQGKGPLDPEKKDVTSRDLYRAASAERKILVIDGWGDEENRIEFRSLIQDAHLSNWQLIVKDHHEVTELEIASTPTMLIGSPDHNIWINRIINDMPISFIDQTILLQDREFDSGKHSLVISYYPNPLNVRMPVGMFTSTNENLVLQLANKRITSYTRGNWSYEILKENQRVLLGNFSQHPDSRWEIDNNSLKELPTGVKQHWVSSPFIFNSYSNDLNSQNMDDFTAECQREFLSITKFCNSNPSEQINYYLYPSTEIKGLMTGNTDQSHLNIDRNEVHTAFDDHFSLRYYGKENQLILRELLGSASFDAMEVGLALYFNTTWEEHGCLYWSRHLIDGGNTLTVQQLLDNDQFGGASRLVREAHSGSFVHFLIDYWGKELFLKRYMRWEPDSNELDRLGNLWHNWVQKKELVIPSGSKQALPYLQGFNFTHEGYQIFNGYGSELSQVSLENVRELGSNAVAIVPYSWMRDPEKPSKFRFSNRAGSENDEGVIHAINKAKQQGLFTMLKPHVWVSNAWPGEVSMASEHDWDQFFENYFQWISHYALMAEIHQVDMLCIGVEFSIATLNQQDRWKRLIQKLRRVYSGNLTYAANWGDEFENIEFWEELDFIGLNCYYPLSHKKRATQKELEQGFVEVLNKVEKVKDRFNRPVIFTEIGFRSVESPWLQPHEEAGNKKFSEKDQALAYSAVFQAMNDHPVVDGVLWWKWPTNWGYRRDQDRRFVPNEKEVEQVIKHWFKR